MNIKNKKNIPDALSISFSIIIFSCLLFCSGLLLLLKKDSGPEIAANIGFSFAAGMGLLFIILSLKSLCKKNSVEAEIEQNLNADAASLKIWENKSIWIMLSAALSLYLELMVVRLHGNFLQLFAYYKNVSLMSCFLGLGLGYALTQKKNLLLALFLPGLAVEILFLNVLRWADLSYLLRNPSSEQATFEIYAAAKTPELMISFGFIILVFVLNTLLFIPIGQLCARLMSGSTSLFAYGWNLIGSLLGIALFSLLSFLWMPPTIWVAIASVGILIFLHNRKTLIPSVFAALFLVALLSLPTRSFLFRPMKYDIYSPYQVLTVILEHEWPRLFANNTWLQSIVDLSPKLVETREDLKPIANYYGLAYKFKTKPKNVLIVGSGTGNDVAAAIRGDAAEIDAVEIDPGIIQIGSAMHPENPYQYARVHIINDDARHYIRHCQKKYDLIVYGLLDSTSTLTANSGGVRMDSYVWTKEGFAEARKLLKPDGIVVCSVCILPELTQKVFLMLKEAFSGQIPIVYNTVWDSGFTFVVANGNIDIPQDIKFKNITESYTSNKTQPDLATDDWPFLWMFSRSYPVSYAIVIGLLSIISVLLVLKFRSKEETKFSSTCFFLGAGFMLVETKGITELALVYGSTWFVTSIVIASVILLALLANIFVSKKLCPPLWLSYIVLFISLIAGWYFAVTHSSFTNFGPELEKLMTTLLLTSPLFFSGFVFSEELKKSNSIPSALSSNLLGAMLGGFIEYNSLYFGYSSLYLFALSMYVLALFSTFLSKIKYKATN